MPSAEAIAALERAGLVETRDGRPRTTRRWQGALARAAARLYASGAPWQDLRLPIASALVELVEGDDETLAGYVEAMLAVEAGELPGAARPAAEPR